MSYALEGRFDKAVKFALTNQMPELAQKYIRKATSLVSADEHKQLWLMLAKMLIHKDLHSGLDYLLGNSPLEF